jgi:hypothetical protein
VDRADRIVGAVLPLAGSCPVRAAGLPGPVGFRFFIVVTHTNSTAQPLLRAPEQAFNKLLRQANVGGCGSYPSTRTRWSGRLSCAIGAPDAELAARVLVP